MNRRRFLLGLAAAPLVAKAAPAVAPAPGVFSGVALRELLDAQTATWPPAAPAGMLNTAAVLQIYRETYDARMLEYARLMSARPHPMLIALDGGDDVPAPPIVPIAYRND